MTRLGRSQFWAEYWDALRKHTLSDIPSKMPNAIESVESEGRG